jgi:NAD+ diphosphatase
MPKADLNRMPVASDWCFVVHAGSVVLRDASDLRAVPTVADLEALVSAAACLNYIGDMAEAGVFAVGGYEVAIEPGDPLGLVPLRSAYSVLGDETWAIASRAAQVVEWDRNHGFCGRCGTVTEKLPTELGRKCPQCGLIAYPRISPATITLVERGDQVLLAHGVAHATQMYALIAGFVEAGETLEECVQREVREEVGIEVDEVRYFGSQSWPFPHSIMLGFTAQYRAGEIQVDPTEIEDARWFDVHSLPMIPQRMSIARRLIDDYALRHGRDPDTL